jgi:sugar lactone lactonase YvrE
MNRRDFIRFPDNCLGNPDGMDVDNKGNLWIAMWDGWSVRKYSSNGVFLEEFTMPFPRPTSCLCLEGGQNRVLVTSARIRISEGLLKEFPLAGSLVSIPFTHKDT